jgi:hypothetical protein
MASTVKVPLSESSDTRAVSPIKLTNPSSTKEPELAELEDLIHTLVVKDSVEGPQADNTTKPSPEIDPYEPRLIDFALTQAPPSTPQPDFYWPRDFDFAYVHPPGHPTIVVTPPSPTLAPLPAAASSFHDPTRLSSRYAPSRRRPRSRPRPRPTSSLRIFSLDYARLLINRIRKPRTSAGKEETSTSSEAGCSNVRPARLHAFDCWRNYT